MPKKKAKTAKKKVVKKVVEVAPYPLVLPPRLYKPIEDLCRDALDYSGNAVGVVQTIRKLSFALRALSDEGGAPVDALGLEALLKRRDDRQRELPLKGKPRDPVEELHRQGHLDLDQRASALLIREIRNAWSRHLTVVGHGFELSGGTTPTRILRDPLSSMGQDLWDAWRGVYTPWYESAKNLFETRKGGGKVAASRLVLTVLVESVFPGALDDIERLERGTCLRVLKAHLTAFSKLREKEDIEHG